MFDRCSSSPLAIFHTRAVPSLLVVSKVSSGEKTALDVSPSCPRITCSSSPVFTSQIRAVASKLALATCNPSAENLMKFTTSPCPAIYGSSRPSQHQSDSWSGLHLHHPPSESPEIDHRVSIQGADGLLVGNHRRIRPVDRTPASKHSEPAYIDAFSIWRKMRHIRVIPVQQSGEARVEMSNPDVGSIEARHHHMLSIRRNVERGVLPAAHVMCKLTPGLNIPLDGCP